ncbi:MAG: FkbM family methyltransferase [Spirochaetota bacterium]
MIWLAAHSLAVLAAGAATLLAPGGLFTAAPLVLAAEGIVAFTILIVQAGLPARRLANVVTGFRLLTAIALLAVAAWPAPFALRLVVALAIAGEISDFVDGRVARAQGTTAFGARLDMETDALFMLSLSLLAVRWFDLPAWIAGAGLVRYLAAIPFLALPDPRANRAFTLFAKVACAASAILLIGTIVPWSLAPTIRLTAGGGAVALLAVSFGWEAVLRVREAGRERGASASPGARRGLLVSVATYYGVPFRQLRTRRFYRRFVAPGDLVFDVGSHVGNRVVSLRALGARVVAVEPQPLFARLLDRLFRDDPEVTVLAAACGRDERKEELRVSSEHPTLSTLSSEWVSSISDHYGELAIEWDERVPVTVTTLDRLIERYGVPSFIKIDVEGYEPEVLAGLGEPVAMISFEFLPASIGPAIESLRLIAELGEYRFRFSLVETMRFSNDDWLDADAMERRLREMPPGAPSGDVYARRVGALNTSE